MNEDPGLRSLDVSPVSRNAPSQQWLIDMPAETAARLLMRSLLEQVANLALPDAEVADVVPWVPLPDTFRSATDRLSTCAALYGDVLTGALPRKIRRRIRALARGSERLHRAEVQVVWLARFMYALPRGDATPVAEGRDDLAAATWLRKRLHDRRSRARATLEQTHAESAQLRRLAKRLGVYTTAVHLDEMAPGRSFGRFTGELVAIVAARLTKHMEAIRPANARSARRALQSVREMTYLLEPMRLQMASVAASSEHLRALQAALEHLADTGAVARVILRSARNVGALHMGRLVKAELSRGHESALEYGTAEPDLRPGLLALARQLRDELSRAFDDIRTHWDEARISGLVAEVVVCGEQLSG